MNMPTVVWIRCLTKHRLLTMSLAALLLICLAAFSAELIANSKPLLLMHGDQLSFPAIDDLIGQQDQFWHWQRSDFMKPDMKAIWPVYPWSPDVIDHSLEQYPSPPSLRHLLGTDPLGRDLLAQLLYSLRSALVFSGITWFLTTLLALVVGLSSGYFGGWFDLFMQRVLEVFETQPFLIVVMVLVSLLGPHLWVFILSTSLFSWMGMALFVRNECLPLRHSQFVLAAQASGASPLRIILVHLLPHALTPVLSLSPFFLAGGLTLLTTMEYLGFAFQQKGSSWGELLAQGQIYASQAWWLLWAPLSVLLLVLCVLTVTGQSLQHLWRRDKG